MRDRQVYGVLLGVLAVFMGAVIFYLFWVIPESEPVYDMSQTMGSIFRMPCAGGALLLVAYGVTLVISTLRGRGPFG